MNEFLAVFLTWQFVLLCLGIAAVTFLVRTLVEYFVLDNPNMPGNSKSRFWRDVFLVMFPVILGIAFPWIGKSFPYPLQIHDPYSKILFCSVAGFFSPTLYRVIKAMLWKEVSPDPQPSVFPVVNQVVVPGINAPSQDPPEPKV